MRGFGRTEKEDPNAQVVRVTQELWQRAEAAGVSEDKFVEAVMGALDASVGPFVERLLRDTPRMLRNRRRIQHSFERRLRKRWRGGLDLFRATLEAALEAGSDFNERHRLAAAQANDFLFEAVTRLHARACLTGFEVYSLLKSGFADAAYARWRTQHELAVVANVLVERGQDSDLAERFLLHERAEHAWDAPSFQRHAAALGYEPFTEEEMNALERARDALVRRFGPAFAKPNGWAAALFGDRPPKFSELEELAGMAHMQPWYKLTSHKVHAGSKGTALNLRERGPYQFMLAGPSNADLADPGHGTLIALTQVTTCLLLRTRNESLADEPLRIVTSTALLRLAEMAGDAFLEAHQRLEDDEQQVWADFSEGVHVE